MPIILKKIHERSAFKDIVVNQKQPRPLSTAAAFFGLIKSQVDFLVHVKASGPLYNDVATQGSKLSFTSAEVGLSDEKNEWEDVELVKQKSRDP